MTPTTGHLAVARWWDEHLVPRLVDLALADGAPPPPAALAVAARLEIGRAKV